MAQMQAQMSQMMQAQQGALISQQAAALEQAQAQMLAMQAQMATMPRQLEETKAREAALGPSAAYAQSKSGEFKTRVKQALLMDAASGGILFEDDADVGLGGGIMKKI